MIYGKQMQIQNAAGKVAAARGGTDGAALIEATAELVSLIREDERLAAALEKHQLRARFEVISEQKVTPEKITA